MIQDQLGRSINVINPKRVLSIVPSLTELICDLGAREKLVGVTKFCVHPESLLKEVSHIGGTKNPRIADIKALKPDLIIANKEENRKEDIDALAIDLPVFVTDIKSIGDSLETVLTFGKILGFQKKALEIHKKLQIIVQAIGETAPSIAPKRALYLIWQKPYMAAGTDTYISKVLALFGIENILSKKGNGGLRYPEISAEEIKALKPDMILLSSEPYPFKSSHCTAFEKEFNIPCKLVDGELFSWYGSRLIHCFPTIPQIKQDIQTIFR